MLLLPSIQPQSTDAQQKSYQAIYETDGLGAESNFGPSAKCTKSTPYLSRNQSAGLLAGRMVSPAFTMHPLHPSLFDDASEEGYPFMATSLTERLVVTAQIMVASIWDIDQKSQLFKTKGSVITWHYDCRLTHGLSMPITLAGPAKLTHIWTPVWHIFNQRSFDSMEIAPVTCVVHASGLVQCTTRFLGQLWSKFDLRNTPYDTQDLVYQINSFGPTDTVIYEWDEPARPIYKEENISAAGWETQQEGYHGWVSEVQDPRNLQKFSKLYASIRIERHQFGILMNSVLPSVLYWLLSSIGFFIPPEALPARAVVGTIPVLMQLNLNNRLQNSFPELQYLPWIIKFTLGNTVLTIANFFAFAWLTALSTFFTQIHENKIAREGANKKVDKEGDLALSVMPGQEPTSSSHECWVPQKKSFMDLEEICDVLLKAVTLMLRHLGKTFCLVYLLFILIMILSKE